jgi:uncharacterized protein YbaR (Trm112 family)
MPHKLSLTRYLADLFARGENLIAHLRTLENRDHNTVEDILISYDFQAGTYIQAYESNPDYLNRYTAELAVLLGSIGSFGSLLEAGCGEATTLSVLGNRLNPTPTLAGFDLSWSRVKLGSRFAHRRGLQPMLFCADLFHIPLADHSVDVVMTSHSLEPNGGREREGLLELARVARKWLVLLEPAYDLAGPECRRRMEHHGYIRNLAEAIGQLDLELVAHRLFPVCANPLNPTALYLVRLDPNQPDVRELRFQCPVSGCPLQPSPEGFYSDTSFLAYPVLSGIPCLLEQNAILATKFGAE